MVYSYNSSVLISVLGFSMTGSNHKAPEVLSVLELGFKMNSYWTKLQTCQKNVVLWFNLGNPIVSLEIYERSMLTALTKRA